MNPASFLKSKKVMVTGGTGSFGHQIVDDLAEAGVGDIVIFSRDEDKHYHMQREYEGNAGLTFVIGDVRNYDRVHDAMRGVDVVFHAAALKHVPSCEKCPTEAVLTNVLGAENVARAAIANGVEKVVGISTDKAVKPVNVMGMTKALQERLLTSFNSPLHGTRFVCVRYGNVIGSRGSVVLLFKKLIGEGKPLPITDPRMTRFLLPLPEAVRLVLKAAAEGKGGEVFVKKMPASLITDLAEVMGEKLGGKKGYPTRITGIRPGEKIHEVLVSEEEMIRATEEDEFFVIHPPKESVIVRNGRQGIREYSSNTTTMLKGEELAGLLRKAGYV